MFFCINFVAKIHVSCLLNLLSIAECGCNSKAFSSCNTSGHCACLPGYTGPKCYECEENYYKTPDDACEGTGIQQFQ